MQISAKKQRKNKLKFRPRLTRREYDLIKQHRSAGNVGIIGDTHEPFCVTGYRNFCYDLFDRYGCSTIIHIGDEVDNHALSYHENAEGSLDALREAELAQAAMDKWYRTFPDVRVCVGNHSALPFRKATTHGIPKRFLKSYEQIWKAPKGWTWDMQYEIDGVLYEHGTGSSGINGARNRAIANRQSTTIGHLHSAGGVSYMASRNDIIFGLNVGCGFDVSSYAASYGKHFPRKPTIGAGVVLAGGKVGFFIPMDLGSKIYRK